MSSLPKNSLLRTSAHGPRGQRDPWASYDCVSVEEGYRRWAPIYDRDPNPLIALEERRLRPMLRDVAGKSVLDLACGTGRWLSWLLEQGASLGIGIDISREMVAIAREKVSGLNRFVRANSSNMPFAAEAFSLVICSFALSHFPVLEAAVREIWRVSAPGASVYVSDLHPQAYARGWHTGFRDSHGAAQIVAWPRSIPEVLAAWHRVGFLCRELAEFRLGEAERPIFARAGKLHMFRAACKHPTLLAFRFQRMGTLGPSAAPSNDE